MPAINGAIGKIVGIVDRARGYSGGQDKAVIGINSGMFFETVMGLILLHDPIRVQVPRELFGLAVFIKPVPFESKKICYRIE